MRTALQIAEARAVKEKLEAARQEEERRKGSAAAIEREAKEAGRAVFNGEVMTISQATVARINSYLRNVALFLRILGWRGNHRTREQIRMTDAELDDYTAYMTREVSTLAVDAVIIEAFLLMQDDKAQRRGWLERWLTRKRAPLEAQYTRFCNAIKRSIYIVKGTGRGPYPQVPSEQEVPDDEEKRDELSSSPEDSAPAESGAGEAPAEEPGDPGDEGFTKAEE